MTYRYFNRNTFSQETPIFHPNTCKSSKFSGSHNIMKDIVNLKVEDEFQARFVRQQPSNKFKHEKQEGDSWVFERDSAFDMDYKVVKGKAIDRQKRAKRGMKSFERLFDEQEDAQDRKLYNGLLQKLLEKWISKAQYVKDELKRVKGLRVGQKFVPINLHQCQYCGKKFAKPCSLGGHVSKLHSHERRQEVKLEEMRHEGEINFMVSHRKH